MKALSRWFRPRWRRLADEADAFLGHGTVQSVRGQHIEAVESLMTAAMKYQAAAAICPLEHTARLAEEGQVCAFRAAVECERFGYDFKREWPHQASPTQQPTEGT